MRVIADRFELLELAGVGGMGAVWRARDRVGGGPVAVKLLAGGGARFAREASLLARLSHPGIVAYVAHGEVDGERFLAMEWLEGTELAVRLEGGPLTVAETLALGSGVADALAAAHAAGVVHRDIKPSNLFLVGGALHRVKILDFGVARARDAHDTATGAIIGTPAYMAPEQARGVGDIDARADVFALGCVLYECLTGRPAFAGDHPLAILGKVVLEDPRPVTELARVPPALNALLGRMLAKTPSARPAHGGEVASALAAVTATSGTYLTVDAPGTALTSGEQRLVSIILVDRADPQMAPTPEVRPTGEAVTPNMTLELPAVVDPVADTAGRFGARLEQLARGTRVVLLAGAGVATDQAARAAQLALALRAAVPDASLALATGRGLLGHRAPVGEALERAARLLPRGAADPPRPCALDEVTAGLLGTRFVVAADAHGALSLVAEREADEARRLLGRETPLVGRERELATLGALMDECQREPAARAVLVTGPAGIGKSRLRYELMRLLAARAPAPEIWLARGEPLGAGSAFALLGAALRRAAGIDGGDPPAARQAKLRARVGRHVPAADVVRLSEFLGEIAGAAFPASVQLAAARADAKLMADQLRRAFEDFCAAETEAGPLVLILEDLHWGDLPTVRLLEAALRHCAKRALYVVGFARPDVHDLFPRLWHERGAQEVRLGELPRSAAERLARHVLGDAADGDLIARIVERSAGNAFFLEELLRNAAGGDEGAPGTVLAMLQSRLESLEADARRFLRAASVFGQTFSLGGVSALLGDTALSSTWLAELERRELVARRRDSRVADDVELGFRHALVREAAYAMLTDQDRALGHRLAGDWLEGIGGADPLVLAEHRERGGEPERAAAWYLRAAELALAADDLEAALAHVDRGLTCGAAGATLGELRRVECEAAFHLGMTGRSVDAASAAMQLLDPSSRSWARVASVLPWSLGALGDVTGLEALAAELDGPPINPLRIVALLNTARALFYSGKLTRGRELVAQAERLGVDDEAVAATLLGLRAVAAGFAGDLWSAGVAWAASAESLTRLGDHRRAANDRHNLGISWMWLGDYVTAERTLREVAPVFHRMGGLSSFHAMLQQNLGYAVMRQGRHDEAMELFTASAEFFAKAGNRRLESAARTYSSMLLLERGDAVAAEREARTCIELVAGLAMYEAMAAGHLAEALLAQGRAAEALAATTPAMAVLAELGRFEERDVNLRLAHARALHALGQVAEARATIKAARDALVADAEKIGDPTVRDRFHRVPEHAQVYSLAEAWGA